jgi:hypothetical protein
MCPLCSSQKAFNPHPCSKSQNRHSIIRHSESALLPLLNGEENRTSHHNNTGHRTASQNNTCSEDMRRMPEWLSGQVDGYKAALIITFLLQLTHQNPVYQYVKRSHPCFSCPAPKKRKTRTDVWAASITHSSKVTCQKTNEVNTCLCCVGGERYKLACGVLLDWM